MAGRWKTVRAFISSTFRDMHAERDHLVKVTFPRLRAWCEARRLHLVDIDLRWGVTKQEADNGKAIEICLKEIDGSRPFFVCILGNRYGFVPDELPPEDVYEFRGLQTETQLSITHLEILHATKSPIPRVDGSRERVCAHSFFYLREPACVPQPESVPVAYRVEFAKTFFEPLPLRTRMLEDLKSDIRTRFAADDRVFNYSGTWDPEAENPEDATLTGRLTQLETFGDRVEADLIRGISEQFADHIAKLSGATDPLEEERGHHEAFIENRTQTHVPRTDVEARLSDYLNDDNRRPLVLSGPPGSGKSAILAHWVKTKANLETWCIVTGGGSFVVPRFIGASPASTNLARLLANICEELRTHYDLHEEIEVDVPGEQPGHMVKQNVVQPMAVPPDPVDVLKKWPRFLNAAAQKGTVLIVIDAINQLDRTSDPTRLYWLPRELPANVKLVVSVLDHGVVSISDYRPEPGEPADWLNVMRRIGYPEIAVPELGDNGRKQIIRELPSVFCKSLDDAQVAALLENDATKNPLYLTVALEELRVFGSFERLPERIATLPQAGPAESGDAIEALFGQVMDRLESETNRLTPGLVPALFSYLASARDGLSEDELEALLARTLPKLAANDCTGAMQVVLRQVRAYTMRKDNLLDFYHRSFWKAVKSKYLDSPQARLIAHRHLANHFYAQFDEGQDRDADAAIVHRHYNASRSLRRLTELPWQLIHAVRNTTETKSPGEFGRDWFRLARVLCDLGFIEAKCSVGHVKELEFEYREALLSSSEYVASKAVRNQTQSHTHDWQSTCTRPDPESPDEISRPICNANVVAEMLWNLSEDARKVRIDDSMLAAQPTNDRASFFNESDITSNTLREIERAETSPDVSSNADSPLARIEAFALFVRSHSHLLRTNPKDAVAMARNYARTGRVAAAAESILATSDRTYLLVDPRPEAPSLHPLRLRTLGNTKSMLLTASLSLDGKTAATAGYGTAISLYDVESGELLHEMKIADPVESILLTPNGQRVIAFDHNDRITIWDTLSGAKLREIDSASNGYRCRFEMTSSLDGRIAILPIVDHCVRVIEVDSADRARTLLTGNARDSALFCSATADGRLCAVLGRRGIYLWDLERNMPIRTWDMSEVKRSSPQGVQISFDGKLIVEARDDVLRIWDTISGRCLAALDLEIRAFRATPDCRIAVTTDRQGVLKVLDLNSDRCLRMFSVGHDPAQTIYLKEDGSLCMTFDFSGGIHIWDLANGIQHVDPVRLRAEPIESSETVSLRGAVTKRTGAEIMFIAQPQTNTYWARCKSRNNSAPEIKEIQLTPDHRLAVWPAGFLDEDHSLPGYSAYVSELRSCRVLWELHGWPTPPLSPDGRLAFGNHTSEIYIYDLTIGSSLRAIPRPKTATQPHEIAVSPDARRIAFGADRSVVVISLWTDSDSPIVLPSNTNPTAITFSPDGQLLAVGDNDGTLRVWRVRDSHLEFERATEWGGVGRIAFSLDAQVIVTLSSSCLICAWAIDQHELLCSTFFDSRINFISNLDPEDRFACGLSNGEVRSVAIKRTGRGHPIVHAVRMFRFSHTPTSVRDETHEVNQPLHIAIPGKYDDHLIVLCPHCGMHNRLPAELHDILNQSRRSHASDQPPTSTLSNGKVMECPACEHSLTVSHAIVDLRDEVESMEAAGTSSQNLSRTFAEFNRAFIAALNVITDGESDAPL